MQTRKFPREMTALRRRALPGQCFWQTVHYVGHRFNCGRMHDEDERVGRRTWDRDTSIDGFLGTLIRR